MVKRTRQNDPTFCEIDAHKDKQARAELEEPELLFCPCCGSTASIVNEGASAFFPYAVSCNNITCGIRTPACRTPAIVASIWNRRVERKPAKRRIP